MPNTHAKKDHYYAVSYVISCWREDSEKWDATKSVFVGKVAGGICFGGGRLISTENVSPVLILNSQYITVIMSSKEVPILGFA